METSTNIDELRLANWIRARYPYARLEALTALKLQKLCFYAAGAAWGHRTGADLGDLTFRAWRHGPVLVSVWQAHRDLGAAPLPPPPAMAPYSPATEQHLRDALDVYGALSAWRLREQSHVEEPWQKTSQGDVIDSTRIRRHFEKKYAAGHVQFPEYLVDVGQFAIDGISVRGAFGSLSDLADTVRASHAEWRADGDRA